MSSSERPHGGSGSCGFSYDQLGFDGVFAVQLGTWPVNTLQEDLGGDASHFAQGLTNGGQGRILESGTLNVVKSDDGNVSGNVEA